MEERVNLCERIEWVDQSTLYCHLRRCIYSELLGEKPRMGVQIGDLYQTIIGVCGQDGVVCVQLPQPQIDAYHVQMEDEHKFVLHEEALEYTKPSDYHILLPDNGR